MTNICFLPWPPTWKGAVEEPPIQYQVVVDGEIAKMFLNLQECRREVVKALNTSHDIVIDTSHDDGRLLLWDVRDVIAPYPSRFFLTSIWTTIYDDNRQDSDNVTEYLKYVDATCIGGGKRKFDKKFDLLSTKCYVADEQQHLEKEYDIYLPYPNRPYRFTQQDKVDLYNHPIARVCRLLVQPRKDIDHAPEITDGKHLESVIFEIVYLFHKLWQSPFPSPVHSMRESIDALLKKKKVKPPKSWIKRDRLVLERRLVRYLSKFIDKVGTRGMWDILTTNPMLGETGKETAFPWFSDFLLNVWIAQFYENKSTYVDRIALNSRFQDVLQKKGCDLIDTVYGTVIPIEQQTFLKVIDREIRGTASPFPNPALKKSMKFKPTAPDEIPKGDNL
ncbi:hypothetical protein FACS1894170_10340 [Planctomycetales bacterium]|nr:hypothetical protein FACS1894170_10340 [Planctomycetales bacterium]